MLGFNFSTTAVKKFSSSLEDLLSLFLRIMHESLCRQYVTHHHITIGCNADVVFAGFSSATNLIEPAKVSRAKFEQALGIFFF
jgi:hypothetical protein